MRRTTAAAMSVVLATGAAACSFDGTLAGPEAAGPSAPAGMLVSNPAATSTSASQAAAPGSFAVSESTIAYLSALPGTFSNAFSVAVRNDTRGGVPKSVLIVDGGFDPFGIEAAAGDELSLALNLVAGGSALMTVTVPRRRPPEVVRTTPIKGRSDVALNVQIAVVFSEPVDRSSINPLSVALLQDGKPVKGRLQVSGDGLRAEFIPDSLLQPQMTYSLEVGQGVRDVDGDALSAALTVTFTTEAAVPVGEIAFVRQSNRQIYRVRIDGGGLTQLTSQGSHDRPVWSPDGKRIAFASSREGRKDSGGWPLNDIYIMDPDGSNVVRRTVGLGLSSVAWSPDGRKLAVSTEGLYYSDIYVINTEDNGAGPLRLAENARSPSWSPDGRKIAFVHTNNDDGYDEIRVMNADGSGVRTLTSDYGGRYRTMWSPDGGRIAFTSCQSGVCNLYAIGSDGFGSVQQLTNAGNVFEGAWSADGAWSVATLWTNSGSTSFTEIVYAPALGGSPRTIVLDGYHASWRPRQ